MDWSPTPLRGIALCRLDQLESSDRPHCKPSRMGHDPGSFRLWCRQLMGSDATLATLMWTTISPEPLPYIGFVGGLVLYPEDISPGGPLTVLYPEPLNISRQDHIPCIGVGLVLYSEPSEVWHVCQGWVHHPMPIKRCRWWTDIWRAPGRWSGLRLYLDETSMISLASWLIIIFLFKRS